jgi:hypothetical protein
MLSGLRAVLIFVDDLEAFGLIPVLAAFPGFARVESFARLAYHVAILSSAQTQDRP